MRIGQLAQLNEVAYGSDFLYTTSGLYGFFCLKSILINNLFRLWDRLSHKGFEIYKTTDLRLKDNKFTVKRQQIYGQKTTID